MPFVSLARASTPALIAAIWSLTMKLLSGAKGAVSNIDTAMHLGSSCVLAIVEYGR